MTKEELFSIGDLSRRSGVPVKTIRHYTDEGVLTLSGTSDGGYRLYSEDDARRLQTIRSLRVLGFSLPAIASMLDGTRDPHDVAALQLDLVDAQLSALQRQRNILAAASKLEQPADVVERLDAAQAAASLGAAERARRLERWLERAQTLDPGEAGRAKIRAMVLDDLPAELSDAQLQAWVRLSALLDDTSFLDVLHEQHEPFAGVTADLQAAFGARVMAVVRGALALLAQGATPADERVRAAARQWRNAFAQALGRENDAAFDEWFRGYASRTNDERIERFWNDVAILRAMPPMPPFFRAQQLLVDALE